MFNKQKSVLRVHLGGKELIQISESDLPIEKNLSAEMRSESPVLTFIDSKDKARNFDLSSAVKDGERWLHLCVRISEHFVCQVDCILNNDPREPNPAEATSGIRFQPFFLAEFQGAPDLSGYGLIGRGLHYPGNVTPGWVSVMVICDRCSKSFRMSNFHTGFSDSEYAYCSQNFHTLLIKSGSDPGADLPSCLECDGSFASKNSLRCPHCQSEFTKFASGFADRNDESYGAYLYGSKPQTL